MAFLNSPLKVLDVQWGYFELPSLPALCEVWNLFSFQLPGTCSSPGLVKSPPRHGQLAVWPKTQRDTVQISRVLYLHTSLLGGSLLTNSSFLSLPKLWSLSPQLSENAIFHLYFSSLSHSLYSICIVPLDKNLGWPYGSFHVFFFSQGSLSFPACCMVSENSCIM